MSRRRPPPSDVPVITSNGSLSLFRTAIEQDLYVRIKGCLCRRRQAFKPTRFADIISNDFGDILHEPPRRKPISLHQAQVFSCGLRNADRPSAARKAQYHQAKYELVEFIDVKLKLLSNGHFAYALLPERRKNSRQNM